MERNFNNSTMRSLSLNKNIPRLNSNNTSILFAPPDPLIQRTFIPLKKPKFNTDLEYIELPPFNHPSNDQNVYEFTVTKQERIKNFEKECSIMLFINSLKMLRKLIYSKTPPDENGKVTIENIVDLNIKKKKNSKMTNFTNTELSENIDYLQFESKFENGNLQLAYINEEFEIKNTTTNNNINENNNANNNNNNINTIPVINQNPKINTNKPTCHKYQLFLHNDTNTNGYSQWFFFKVSNGKKGEKYNFQIMNFSRGKSKYSYGLKVWVYSTKKSISENIGWHHTKEDVNNYPNHLYRMTNDRRKNYGTLSFDYTFEYANDTVYFANCIPYTYSDLMRDLNEYQKYQTTKYPFFIRKTLCTTLGGNDLDYIIINSIDSTSNNLDLEYRKKKSNNVLNISCANTLLSLNSLDKSNTIYSSKLSINANNSQKLNSKLFTNAKNANNINKEGVILLARIHPSETVGSWTVKGSIEFLLGQSDEANYLRDNFIFKIIPMLNPDGVINGCTRTSYSGCDLNRRWTNQNEYLYPEICSAKNLILSFAEQRKVSFIVDYHGHFGCFNSFFFCNRDRENFTFGKFFPFLCAKISDYIQFERCKFSMMKYKRGTGRIDLFKELNLENIVTLESSNFGCISGKNKNKYFNINMMKQIGIDVCLGILKYHYSKQNKMTTYISQNNYSKLEEKLANELKNIETDFDIYIASKINPQKNNKNTEKKGVANNDEDNNNLDLDDDDDEDKKKEGENKKCNGDDDDDDNDDDNGEEDDDDSESDHSADNLDIDTIIKLIPKKKKNFKKNKKKVKKLSKVTYNNINIKKINNNINNNESLTQNNLLVKLPQIKPKPVLEDKKENKKTNRSNLLLSSNDVNLAKINKDIQDINKLKTINIVNTTAKNININAKEDLKIIEDTRYLKIKISSSTQTEEIFFKMHWSYFLGTYTILTGRIEVQKIIKVNNKGSYNINGSNINNINNININNNMINNNNANNRNSNNINTSNNNNINNSPFKNSKNRALKLESLKNMQYILQNETEASLINIPFCNSIINNHAGRNNLIDMSPIKSISINNNPLDSSPISNNPTKIPGTKLLSNHLYSFNKEAFWVNQYIKTDKNKNTKVMGSFNSLCKSLNRKIVP